MTIIQNYVRNVQNVLLFMYNYNKIYIANHVLFYYI